MLTCTYQSIMAPSRPVENNVTKFKWGGGMADENECTPSDIDQDTGENLVYERPAPRSPTIENVKFVSPEGASPIVVKNEL